VIDSEVLNIPGRPETHQGVRVAEPALIEKLNQQITSAKLLNRAGQPITEKMEGGLVRADGKLLFPICEHIPVVLMNGPVSLSV
jgi:uncharacterized protein YbaR (Trm112 family)